LKEPNTLYSAVDYLEQYNVVRTVCNKSVAIPNVHHSLGHSTLIEVNTTEFVTLVRELMSGI